ncbi:MAG: malto-oligosyltrehalose trehalohydrolase [Elainellaceae cyanobacterium]
MRVGTEYLGDRHCRFTVWAPLAKAMAVQLVESPPRIVPLDRGDQGYWQAIVAGVEPGALYQFQINGETLRPDPASQCQPQGVHGPSAVVDHQFDWQSLSWQSFPLPNYLIYELHVGTFTPEGTFAAIIPRLPDLLEMGINAIELMPVGQFPGDRNWGYDGVYPFSVQPSYGGVEGLKQLVDACHQQGMAVVLDVIYNHFGPEGNYTRDFGPYFTDRYRTPWGSAINFDDAHSDGVRNFVIENALYWFREFRLDGLRLDAIHAIYDFGARHILAEMNDRVTALAQEAGRPCYLIAESDLNDVRVIRPPAQGGYGLDAQWNDDFHHCVHTLLTGESDGYYLDFGTCEQFAKVWTSSFAYTWTYSPHRQRYHGSDARDRPPSQFVVCAQNHDQVGNRMMGDRLSTLVGFESLKLAAGAVILAPAIPLLFMGEEYGEEAPFLYFISHSDPELARLVREGRKREFAAFHATGEAPDADSPETFRASTLRWEQRTQGQHGVLRQFYQTLIQLRRTLSPITHFDRDAIEVQVDEGDRTVRIHHWQGDEAVLIGFNFSPDPQPLPKIPPGTWQKQIDSAAAHWRGPGSALPDRLDGESSAKMQPTSVTLYSQVL